MATSRVTSKGQTTIPKEIRKELGIEAGDRVVFILRDGEVVLYPVKETLLDLRGSIKPRKRPEDLQAVRREVKQKLAKKVARGSSRR